MVAPANHILTFPLYLAGAELQALEAPKPVDGVNVSGAHQGSGHEQAKLFSFPDDTWLFALLVELDRLTAGPVIRGKDDAIVKNNVRDGHVVFKNKRYLP